MLGACCEERGRLLVVRGLERADALGARRLERGRLLLARHRVEHGLKRGDVAHDVARGRRLGGPQQPAAAVAEPLRGRGPSRPARGSNRATQTTARAVVLRDLAGTQIVWVFRAAIGK